MKKFYLFKKEGKYFSYDPFYGELLELTISPIDYFEYKYYVEVHNDLDKLKDILESYSVSFRKQFQIVEFKFEIVETTINF